MASEQDLQYVGPDLGGHASAPELSRAQAIERDRAMLGLLRQLAGGLSSYRLFPGDLKQPTFVQAVQRIRHAAEAALAWGPFEAEINGKRFITPTGPAPSDEQTERFALVFYEHGAERLSLRGVPDARELGVLYEALSLPVGTGTEPGAVGSALRVAGVKTIAVREVAPQGTERGELRGGPTQEQRALWEHLRDPQKLAADMAAGPVGGDPAQTAIAAFGRFQQVVATLPPRLVRGFQLYSRLHEVMANLPPAVRRGLMRLFLERVREDELSERMVGTMTDAELARVLVDQGLDGTTDPVEWARRLVGQGVRQDDLIDLTAALQEGQVEGGTIIAGLDRIGSESAGLDDASPVARTVSNLLVRSLVSAGQEDVRSIRDDFPGTEEEERNIAYLALYDYLRTETDQDRLGEVLGGWAEQATEAVKRRDLESVRRLLDVIGGAEEGGAADKHKVAEASIKRVLSPDVLRELVSVTDGQADGQSDPARTVELLAAFRDVAVDCLMEDLAQEQDRGRRGLLLSVLAQVARGRHETMAKWLDDPRWFVARNAVTVLNRSGDRSVVPLLAKAARHHEPAVRKEAARALVEVAGLDAMPQLLELAGDSEEPVRTSVISALGAVASPEACEGLVRMVRLLRDTAGQRRALEALARHPAPGAAAALDELAAYRTRPRLPGRIRRYAKTLAKNRRTGAA